MRYCPICERTYGDEAKVCEVDGSLLRDSTTHQDPLLGKIIRGRYRVLEKLGEGGMGSVYLAEQIAISRKVALKLLHSDYARDQDFVRRFRQEAKLAASLSHRNIVTVFDFDQADDGSLYIVMEYVAGKSLSQLIQDGPIDLNKALRLGVQIGEGLRAAHRTGVIHRDIKPDNIMVVGGEEIKLMDFGIARLTDSEAATRLTRSGMIMGTPTYMAPEQIEGGEVGEATDIYAFGVVLYEMLSGSAPFKASTPGAILVKHLQETPVPLRKLRKDLPASLEKTISQALEKKPEQRQRSMAELVESLERAERDLSVERTSAAAAIVQPLKLLEQKLHSLSSEVRRLVQKALSAVPRRTTTIDEITPATREQDAETAPEASAVAVEPSSPVEQTEALSAAVEKESPLPISSARRVSEDVRETVLAPPDETVLAPSNETVLARRDPIVEEQFEKARLEEEEVEKPGPNAAPVSEEPATMVVETASDAESLAQPKQNVNDPVTLVTTAIPASGWETRAETAPTTTTEAIQPRKTKNWRWMGIGISASAVVALVIGVLFYREIVDQQTQGTQPAEEKHESQIVAKRPDTLPTAPATKVELEAEKIPQPIEASGTKPATAVKEKTTKEPSRMASVSSPPAESKSTGPKKPEAVKPTPIEPIKASKAAPPPDPPAAPKAEPQETKITDRQKPPDVEKPAPQERSKSESETKVASIQKPVAKESSTALPESRLLSLAIVSSRRDINVKERVLLTVRGKYSDGRENEIVAGVRWESSDATVAIVNSRGELEGRKAGKAEITAKYAGLVSSTYTLEVKPNPQAEKAESVGERIQDQRRRLLR